jgi:hypothetical protein
MQDIDGAASSHIEAYQRVSDPFLRPADVGGRRSFARLVVENLLAVYVCTWVGVNQGIA